MKYFCFVTCSVPDGLGVRIPGFHPGGPGSIPGLGASFFIRKSFCTSPWESVEYFFVAIPYSQFIPVCKLYTAIQYMVLQFCKLHICIWIHDCNVRCFLDCDIFIQRICKKMIQIKNKRCLNFKL